MNRHIEDIFLLQRIKAGDEGAFKFLFEMYFTSIYRFLFIYIKEKSIVEEIALDVFTVFWEKREMIEIKVSLKAYLFQSARNQSINYIRSNKHIISENYAFPELSEEYNFLEAKELETLIEEAICSLPEKRQQVFRKSREDNLTNKEIASEMGITVKAVEAQITKALKHIKSYLGDSYNFLW